MYRLAHRIWQINKIPRDQLEEKLGLEIPPVPDLSLGGIYPTSVLLHWLGSRDGQSAISNLIEVNGVKIGEFRQGDTSIEILGLTPGNCYSIRVIAFNLAGHSASAPTIRVQTGLGISSTQDASVSGESSEPASIRTTSSRIESSELHSAVKDGNGIPNLVSRSVIDPKNSGSVLINDQSGALESPLVAGVENESPEHIRELIQKLESLKAQKEEVEKQIEEDDMDSRTQIADLAKEKERLKQAYKEKEEASAELRKHGNHLDKLNRSAQSRKAAKEKQLQQKKAERQRVKDDIARWDREIVEMRNDIENMAHEKTHVLVEKEFFVAGKRKALADDQAAIKTLEEDIRVKGIQIKALEQTREEMNIDCGADEELDRIRVAKEKDEAWEYRYQNMQAELAHRRQELQTANMEEQRAKDVLTWWLEKRARNGEQFIPIPGLEFPSVSRNKSRRSRHSNSRTSTISSSNYQGRPASLGDDSVMVPPFAGATPFFNMGNGTAISPGSGQIEPSQEEANILIGGALMSPAANELLPSNLFRDEDMANQLFPAVRRDSSGNNGNDGFVRHAVPASDSSNRGPNTPASGSSRGGSILPSPHESMHNLHGYHSRSDTFDDNDRQSISSIPASLRPSLGAESNPLAPNRFANLFSSPFSRQRGKSNGQEPPMLGTLKQGQSHSFDIDDVGGRRRRGSHGYWANPIGGLLARNSAGPGTAVMTSSGRKSRLNMFGSKLDSLEPNAFADQPSSSRPSSTYSHDGLLGRLSTESQHAMWPAPDGLPNRNSPIGVNWAPNSSGPWSHLPSRRPSVQHESTSNLSLGTVPLEPDEYVGLLRKQTCDQAPIGTRPQSSQRPATPKLNPAAPSFKTLFSRGDAKKTTKQEKVANKASDKLRDKEIEKVEADDGESINDSSPPNSRLSRDAQSITTATSAADSYDSIDRSTSGTPSEAMTPSGPKEPKESLMQKITRKSSSSKFNVPWSKDRAGGGLFSKRAGEPSTPGEIDEDTSSEGQLGKSVESPGGTLQQEKSGRTSLSWPNIRRKSRKGEVADKNSEAGEDDD